MAKPYFRQVPNFEYVSRVSGEQNISDYINVKNLFKKGKLREDIFGDLNFFTKYKIIGDERPDNVAYKIYNDSTLDWIVLLSNNILNIQTEWPLSQKSFDQVMLEKYGSYENLYSGIHHYETTEIRNSLNNTVINAGLRISPTWKTNGNFVEIISNEIAVIKSGNAVIPSTTVEVNLFDGIEGLQVGDQVTIEGVSDSSYNGKQIVTSILVQVENSTITFQYELPSVPAEALPALSTPRNQFVRYSLGDVSNITGNSYYYEYWDEGLGYSVLVPSTTFVRAVTNYEYESQLEDDKRNIFVLKPQYLNIIFNDLDDIMPYKKGGAQYVNATLKKGDNIRLYT